jgi:2,4-dienoyl-CoA reductase-like NADH-dependent reductase (Old Yellow Enzyme family)
LTSLQRSNDGVDSDATTRLLQPHTFGAGDLTVRNRLVFVDMTTKNAGARGEVSHEALALLTERSRDVGMTITAPCFVSYDGHLFEGQWSCANDDLIPSLKRAADAIKSTGALAVLQLHHGGGRCLPSVLGHQPLGPSAVCIEPGMPSPREMTESEIERTIAAFGQAARRAIRAGFDGVEITGGRGYLLHQFFSPRCNRRTDQWGGALENRAAFPIAVFEEVQEVVRRNAYRPFSIGYMLTAEDEGDGGITIKETLGLVEGIVACRPDWLHVDAGAASAALQTIAVQVEDRTTIIASGQWDVTDGRANALDLGADLVVI